MEGHFGMQGAMHRTSAGDVEQLGALVGVERTDESDVAFDPVDHPCAGLAFGAILGVDAGVARIDDDVSLPGPLSATRTTPSAGSSVCGSVVVVWAT
jgi:hypothetical protein